MVTARDPAGPIVLLHPTFLKLKESGRKAGKGRKGSNSRTSSATWHNSQMREVVLGLSATGITAVAGRI